MWQDMPMSSHASIAWVEQMVQDGRISIEIVPPSERDLYWSPTSLYAYLDIEDHVIYVGITMGLKERHSMHKSASPWFPEVTRREHVTYPLRFAARYEEIRMIQTFRPRHNKTHL